MKINQKLHVMVKVDQEGSIKHGAFKRYLAPYMRQPSKLELEQLERENKATK